jgi:hypothetical protein
MAQASPDLAFLGVVPPDLEGRRLRYRARPRWIQYGSNGAE